MNRQWVLVRRPDNSGVNSVDGCLELRSAAAPTAESLRDGEVLVQVELVSLDPTVRIWMTDAPQYMAPVMLGEVMRAGALGVVRASRSDALPVGSYVSGLLGMQDFWVGPAAAVSRIPYEPGSSRPLSLYCGLLGMIGATAYFGLLEVAKVREGDVVVVSGAAGAVGSLVGQLAKARGARRVVGIAGGAEKCRQLTEEFGYDAAVDYTAFKGRPDALRAAVQAAAQVEATGESGVNVYFENVGGEIGDAVLMLMANFGRVAVCGLISGYNDGQAPCRSYSMAIMRRLTITGFVVSDFLPRWGEAFAYLGKLLDEGRLVYKIDERSGLENAPESMKALFDGSNKGKLVVRV